MTPGTNAIDGKNINPTPAVEPPLLKIIRLPKTMDKS